MLNFSSISWRFSGGGSLRLLDKLFYEILRRMLVNFLWGETGINHFPSRKVNLSLGVSTFPKKENELSKLLIYPWP